MAKEKMGDYFHKIKEADALLAEKTKELKVAKQDQKNLEKKCRDIEREIDVYKDEKATITQVFWNALGSFTL